MTLPTGKTVNVEALARLAVGGGDDAVDAWFRADHPTVWKLAFGFLGHAAEADDLAQEAMVKLLDHLKEWDMRRSYRAWRSTVVANLCRDRLRRLETRSRAEARRAPRSAALPGPEAALDQGEIRDLLAQALDILSPRERQVFVLRDLEDHSHAEIAEVLEISESSVRSQLTVARQRLRDHLSRRICGA